MIRQGEVWWVDLPEPVAGESGFRRPVVVVQADAFTAGGLRTIVAIPLTSNVGWAGEAGCVTLSASSTELPKDSVALAFQIRCMDAGWFVAKAGSLSPATLDAVLTALDDVLGR